MRKVFTLIVMMLFTLTALAQALPEQYPKASQTVAEAHVEIAAQLQIGDLVGQFTTPIAHGGIPSWLVDEYQAMSCGRKLTHCGTVVVDLAGNKYVSEAPGNNTVAPLTDWTPVMDWLARGQGGLVRVKRKPGGLSWLEQGAFQVVDSLHQNKFYADGFKYTYDPTWTAGKAMLDASVDILVNPLEEGETFWDRVKAFTPADYCTTKECHTYLSIGYKIVADENVDTLGTAAARAPFWAMVFGIVEARWLEPAILPTTLFDDDSVLKTIIVLDPDNEM